MSKLKMSWTGSDWTLSGEEDTGTSTAPFTKTAINLLSVLTMGGFVASQVVQEGTSIHLLDMRYAPDIANRQRLKLNNVTGQTCGSAWIHYNPTSREYHTMCSTNLDGDGFLVDSECLQESLYLTSARTEARSNSSRSGTMTQTEDSLSLPDVRPEYMERNVSRAQSDTSASQRVAETQLSSECVESLLSRARRLLREHFSGTLAEPALREESSLLQSPIEMRQERNSSEN